MDERAAIVEGTETCQGELTVEDGSMDNGTTDADGAQARGAEGVSVAQNAELVGSNGSIDSGGIAGAGAQFGVRASPFGAESVATVDGRAPEGIPRPQYYNNFTKDQRKKWNRRHKWNGQYE